jgi:hypothetical protein
LPPVIRETPLHTPRKIVANSHAKKNTHTIAMMANSPKM